MRHERGTSAVLRAVRGVTVPLPQRGGVTRAAKRAGVSSMMQLPAHFWLNTNFCPVFPITKVKWTTAKYKPVPGVVPPDALEDGAEIV